MSKINDKINTTCAKIKLHVLNKAHRLYNDNGFITAANYPMPKNDIVLFEIVSDLCDDIIKLNGFK